MFLWCLAAWCVVLPAKPATIQELWAGYDPHAEPLETTVTKSWDEGPLHLEQLTFTGETWQSEKVRVFAYRGAPSTGEKLPGILHIHGGGQTASLDWVRYWAGRGYVCVSHDFCGSGPGRAPEKVTQWGTAPARMIEPAGPKSSLHPTPRHNQWYHWILVARRALTLLESRPKTDPAKLGVFGISVGGTLTWMVAGCDSRVTAAAPIYGVGQNTYTFPWQSPNDPVDEETRLTRALFEPESYASDVKCPLLFLNASNDHHGRLDFGMRTLSLTTQSKMLREIYTPRALHHIGPAEAPDLPLWMDYHLKGTGPAWPESPKLEILNGPVAQLSVAAANPGEVESVTAFYGLNNLWPASRFYRTVPLTAGATSTYTGPAPVLSPDDTIYAFANIAYRSGIRLSTRLIKISAKDLPGIKPSLQRTALIDSMDDDRAWFWWQAPTDPLNLTSLLAPWTGPSGERGFTHAQPGVFSFATMAIGDPQFKSDGSSALLLDVHAASYPATLEISVATKFFQPGQVTYKSKPARGEPANGWITLRMTPGDFRDDKGVFLTNWKDVDFPCLSGTGNGSAKTVFKNLRREKTD
ncbi:MAG TPA: dienelactone hydrolase family protein [Verrucomicrobiales bacterium]|nr:dienelactone hydrolase family protein [Verrucomicrobiales bacterium]